MADMREVYSRETLRQQQQLAHLKREKQILEAALARLTTRYEGLEQVVKDGLNLIDPYAVPNNGLFAWCLRAQKEVGVQIWETPEVEQEAE